jgi:hypothetical protein
MFWWQWQHQWSWKEQWQTTPLASPDALTSSTRTDITYPPTEDLTRTLLKYAKTANLQKLSNPTDLLSRQWQLNTFMDNLRIVLQHFTMDTLRLWPLAKTNQLFSSIHWYSHLQLDLHKHQWSLPETHYWLSTRCQDRNPDSETSLCTAHSRSHWMHARRFLLH